MSNSANTSPPGIEGSANKALTPSLATLGRSASHGAATVQQANLTSDGDDISISSQGTRKRDKILKFFRPAKSEEKVIAGTSPTKMHDTPSAATEAKKVSDAGSSVNVIKADTRTESMVDLTSTCCNIFPSNVTRPSCGTDLPKPGARIETTPQLVLCSSILNSVPSLHDESNLEKDLDHSQDAFSQNVLTNDAHRDWVKHFIENPVEQHHIRWLLTRMIEEFAKDAVKGSDAITEVILLGPVLNGEQYRSLLSCFINKFD
ncbi:hypothetical protein BGZ68_003146, partial [Mortierella alpina]